MGACLKAGIPRRLGCCRIACRITDCNTYRARRAMTAFCWFLFFFVQRASCSARRVHEGASSQNRATWMRCACGPVESAAGPRAPAACRSRCGRWTAAERIGRGTGGEWPWMVGGVHGVHGVHGPPRRHQTTKQARRADGAESSQPRSPIAPHRQPGPFAPPQNSINRRGPSSPGPVPVSFPPRQTCSKCCSLSLPPRPRLGPARPLNCGRSACCPAHDDLLCPCCRWPP